MKKKSTLLIIVVIVAIAMIGFYLAIGLIKGGNVQTDGNAEQVVTLADIEDLVYVQYTNAEGTVTLIKENNVWINEENKELELLSDFVTESVGKLTKIQGTLVEGADKAECGLEEPTYTCTIKNDKETVKYSVGFSEAGVCYVMMEGKTDIYRIDDSIVYFLNWSAESYVESDLNTYFSDLEGESTDLIGDEEYAEDTEDTGIVEEPEVEEPTVDEVPEEPSTDETENVE